MPPSAKVETAETLPLSLLNDYLYCPRRAALKAVEGWRQSNVHTERGDIVHEHADLPGYEVAQGVTLLRALPVWSERLGLNGKCDIVEVTSIQNQNSKIANQKSYRPVEFKLGKRRKFENDDAQLCAQAMCLEEMFGVEIPVGAIFHAESKRRREVEFTPELRRLTEQAARELQEMVAAAKVPAAVYKPACEECSLFEVCLPRVMSRPARLVDGAAALFEA